jgi:hypothetical protein
MPAVSASWYQQTNQYNLLEQLDIRFSIKLYYDEIFDSLKLLCNCMNRRAGNTTPKVLPWFRMLSKKTSPPIKIANCLEI